MIPFSRETIATVNRARNSNWIFREVACIACNRGYDWNRWLKCYALSRREYLDAVERVWRGSGLCDWQFSWLRVDEVTVEPGNSSDLVISFRWNAPVLPRCSFNTITLRSHSTTLFSHSCSRPELNRHRTYHRSYFHSHPVSFSPILIPILFSFPSRVSLISTRTAKRIYIMFNILFRRDIVL